MNASKPWRAFVCSHTHWDREWYGSFQEYRYRLVRLMDRLLRLLAEKPTFRCFNLDGQTVVLEDYLEIRPEKEEELRRHIGAGRISVGPWYVLPDEFLEGPEALIRNLLRGHRLAEAFGHCSRVGYLPDMFGHISQMPQILRGFGLDNAILWRGLSGEDWPNELWWEAPDGSRVLVEHILEYCGYCNAALFAGSLPPSLRGKWRFPDGRYVITPETEKAAEALVEIVRKTAEKATTDCLLLFNGIDHMEPQPELPEALAAAARRAREEGLEVEFLHTTFEEFVAALREAVGEGKDLPVVRGELRETVWTREGGGLVLPNVLSSRIYLKLANARCQTALEKWAEPLGVFAWLLGEEYHAALTDKAWQWLLQNHPHDSIGGCSIDAVHRQMETRFEWALEIAETLTNEYLWRIAERTDTSGLAEDEVALLVFNPLPWRVEGLVPVEFDLDHDWLAAQGLGISIDNPYRTFRSLQVRDAQGEEAPFQIRSLRATTVHRPHIPLFAPVFGTHRVQGWLWAALPPGGYTTYRVRVERKPRLTFGSLVTGPNQMENEFLRVRILPNGTLTLFHKATGHTFQGLGYFEDGGDNGDGYTYSPPRHDEVYTTLSESPRIALVENGPAAASFRIEYEWWLPAELAPHRQARSREKKPLRIVSTVTLGRSSRRVDIETQVENTVKDHRLRVVFPTWLAVDHCWAEGHFDVLRRPVSIPQPPLEVWKEDQPRQYPQQSFCDVSNGQVGLAILNVGLPEFQVSEGPERAIALTLLRAVNYLGADGFLNTIMGGAGPFIETPDSQCQRCLTFRYALLPHAGDWRAAGVQREAHHFNAGVRCIVTRRHEGELPLTYSFVSLEGEDVVLSALKRSEDGQAVIVRLWNGTEEGRAVSLRLAHPPSRAWLADLRERPLEELPVRDGILPLQVGAKRIVTVRVEVPLERGA